MAYDDNVKKAKAPTILSNQKLKISAPCPTAKGVYSTLGFDTYRNNPRIVVNTNDPSLKNQDNNWGRIHAALDPAVFGAFIELLIQAVSSKSEWRMKLENGNHSYVNNQRSQEITPETDVWVGRTKEDEVYVSVISKKENFPVIKFLFGPADGRYHKFFHGDGKPYTRAEVSNLFARAYIRLLTAIVPILLTTQYEPPAPPTGGFGGNRNGRSNSGYNGAGHGGGNNSSGGNSTGGGIAPYPGKSSAPMEDFTDDVPF